MPAKDVEVVRKMYSQMKPTSEIEKYAKDHVRNPGQIRSCRFAKFRESYLGKGKCGSMAV
jgi:hypothetical protein